MARKEWLRAAVVGRPAGVDREAGVIRGYVVAQQGPFKSEGRGEFDQKSLARIVQLMNAEQKGLKVRLGHPTLSDDGIGKYLGRAKAARLDGDRVRADLHFSTSARRTPHGDLASYIMDRAEEDPESFGSSLVLHTDEELRTDSKGRRLLGDDGEPLPPLWRPTELHASDVVDEGDAVHDGFLGAFVGLPDELPRAATAALDRAFAGQPRNVVECRCEAWLKKYLELRFGPPLATPLLEEYRKKLAERGIAS